jgi:hypothetical protein
MKLNINAAGRLNQWLTHKEVKRGLQRVDVSAQLFVDSQKELELLANNSEAIMEVQHWELLSSHGSRTKKRQSKWPGKWWALSDRNCEEDSPRDSQQ